MVGTKSLPHPSITSIAAFWVIKYEARVHKNSTGRNGIMRETEDAVKHRSRSIKDDKIKRKPANQW